MADFPNILPQINSGCVAFTTIHGMNSREAAQVKKTRQINGPDTQKENVKKEERVVFGFVIPRRNIAVEENPFLFH